MSQNLQLISEIDFSLPGALPPTRTYEFRTSPTSGSAATYTAGGVIQFSIPSMPRSFFENNTTYITGRTTFTAGSANTAGTDLKFFPSGGAYSQFSKWALRSANGMSLDNIDNPGYLAGLLMNVGMTVGQKVACANTILTSDQSAYVNVGLQINTAADGGRKLVVDWAIPMIGVWNSSKYFPAWGNELLLELTINSLANFILDATSIANTGFTAFTITNLELVTQILEFSPESFQQLQGMYGPVIQIKSETYSFGSYLIPASTGAGQLDVPFNIRVKSLKRLLMLCSPANAAEGVGYGSVNPNLDYFQFVSNGNMYPQRGVQCTKPAEVFMQLLRAFGSIYSTDKPTSISIEGFRSASTAYVADVYEAYNTTKSAAAFASSSDANQFYMVLDLETLSNQKEGLYNGINTTGSTANNIRLNINTALAAQTHYLYFFSCHDAIISLDFVNGITQVIV